MAIIQSLCDTDLYKFTMMQCVYHQFSGAQVAYRYKCRNENADLRPFVQDIGREIEALAELRFTSAELEYLSGIRFIRPEFVDFLESFRFNPKYVDLAGITNPERDFIRGPWMQTILFETPCLAIVTETYYRNTVAKPDFTEGKRRLHEKIEMVQAMPMSFKITEFGTRRRFSREWQEHVLGRLKDGLLGRLFGTSNVDLARRYKLTPVGTMAHEFLQACQVLGGNLRDFQKFAFDAWSQEYRGDLGIALTDTIGIDAFVADFDMFYCKLFDGCRIDSGDPIQTGEKLIAMYKANRVDPATKVLMFTDKLNIPKARAIYRHFEKRALPAFGIGTDLVNDVGYEALDSVIKMVSCNDRPVAKLSDSAGKTICPDHAYIDYLRHIFKRYDAPSTPKARPPTASAAP
ncbi:MAG: nicotinate phosphoribosyltransferase [Betaproteobacteria bacterium]|nr:nicotinate phosphoribosyltransferase [Betaproteobacteria bacterium]